MILDYQIRIQRRRAGRGRLHTLTSLIFLYGTFILGIGALAAVFFSPKDSAGDFWTLLVYGAWVLPVRLGDLTREVVPSFRRLGVTPPALWTSGAYLLLLLRNPLFWAYSLILGLLIPLQTREVLWALWLLPPSFLLGFVMHNQSVQPHFQEDFWILAPLGILLVLRTQGLLTAEAGAPWLLPVGAGGLGLLRMAFLRLDTWKRKSQPALPALYRRILSLRFRLGTLALWSGLWLELRPEVRHDFPGLWLVFLWPLGTWIWFLAALDLRRQVGGLGTSDLWETLRLSRRALRFHGWYVLGWIAVYFGGLSW